jgi:FKBP-type peptidyl-prolyl cis-trans isomerase 2
MRTYALLTYLVGSGQMIKGLYTSLIKMKGRGEKTLTITPEKASGEFNKCSSKAFMIKLLSLENFHK